MLLKLCQGKIFHVAELSPIRTGFAEAAIDGFRLRYTRSPSTFIPAAPVPFGAAR
jgi:hypothetical protein